MTRGRDCSCEMNRRRRARSGDIPVADPQALRSSPSRWQGGGDVRRRNCFGASRVVFEGARNVASPCAPRDSGRLGNAGRSIGSGTMNPVEKPQMLVSAQTLPLLMRLSHGGFRRVPESPGSFAALRKTAIWKVNPAQNITSACYTPQQRRSGRALALSVNAPYPNDRTIRWSSITKPWPMSKTASCAMWKPAFL